MAHQTAGNVTDFRKNKPLRGFDIYQTQEMMIISGPVGPLLAKWPELGYVLATIGAGQGSSEIINGDVEQGILDLSVSVLAFRGTRNQLKFKESLKANANHGQSGPDVFQLDASGKAFEFNSKLLDYTSPINGSNVPGSLFRANQGTFELKPQVLDLTKVFIPNALILNRQPGSKGIKLDSRMRRLQQEQIDFISEEYGIEFAQITNQVTGEKWLFSGDRRNVGIELPGGDQTMGDWWWDWHNHPSGSSEASIKDMYFLGKWIAAQRDGRGPIQSSSTIYPTGKEPFEFTPINPRVEK